MKRFVISTNRTTTQQDQVFYKILRERFSHLGWWHQLGETWLLVDLTDTGTVRELRDAAQEAFPGIHLLVIEIKGEQTWAGYGPPDGMFKWIREEWSRKP